MQNKKADRAIQFMPFDGLKGFKEEIAKVEKVIVNQKELSEDSLENLQYKMSQVKKGMMIQVIYYSNNEYIKTMGLVSKIDIDNKVITIVKTKIKIDDIYDISSEQIKDLECD